MKNTPHPWFLLLGSLAPWAVVFLPLALSPTSAGLGPLAIVIFFTGPAMLVASLVFVAISLSQMCTCGRPCLIPGILTVVYSAHRN